jgi:hypothetical protein
VRVGGSRRPSVSFGAGPVGVTLGGRRKGRGGWKIPTTTDNDSYYEPTREEKERSHAYQVHQEVTFASREKVLAVLEEHDWPFLHTLLIRCTVLGAFIMVVLFTTGNAAHVLFLYLIYAAFLIIGPSPAAMYYQMTTVPDEKWRLSTFDKNAVQIGRVNIGATVLPVWVCIAAGLFVDPVKSLFFTSIYILVVTVTVSRLVENRTKSKVVVREEMKLLVQSHFFNSVPKNSMLKYEQLLLQEKLLKVLIEISANRSKTDSIYAAYFDPKALNKQLLDLTEELVKFEKEKQKTEDGRQLLLLSKTCYRDLEYSERLKRDREHQAERMKYYESISGDRFKPPSWRVPPEPKDQER